MEDYSHQKIGELLGIAEGTSKSQLARARRLLETRLAAGRFGRHNVAEVALFNLKPTKKRGRQIPNLPNRLVPELENLPWNVMLIWRPLVEA